MPSSISTACAKDPVKAGLATSATSAAACIRSAEMAEVEPIGISFTGAIRRFDRAARDLVPAGSANLDAGAGLRSIKFAPGRNRDNPNAIATLPNAIATLPNAIATNHWHDS